MKEYKEGQEVLVSVEELYLKFGKHIMYGDIEVDAESEVESERYFDLYNDDKELACMDGENCLINQVGTVLLTLRNDNGDGSIYFNLTKEEADVAIFGL